MEIVEMLQVKEHVNDRKGVNSILKVVDSLQKKKKK